MRRIGFVCGLVIVGIIASLALTMDANAQKPFEIWNATYDEEAVIMLIVLLWTQRITSS